MNRSTSVTERSCPACGGQTGHDRGQKNGFPLVSCTTCTTLYTARHPEEIREQYDAYYTAANLTVPTFIDKRLDEIVATFEPYRQNNRLLDIGCGAGSFLQAAARRNWKAFGLEVSQSAIEHLRNLGFEVFHGELDQANYADGYFDLVIASELLEHLPNPRALLISVSRVLRPGGLFWATTPHGRGISGRILGVEWSNVCPPEHLQLFSVTGIRMLLSAAGFRHVNVATHGTNPFEIAYAVRHKAHPPPENGSQQSTNFNRVDSSYQLNEFFSEKAFPARGESDPQRPAQRGPNWRFLEDSSRKTRYLISAGLDAAASLSYTHSLELNRFSRCELADHNASSCHSTKYLQHFARPTLSH